MAVLETLVRQLAAGGVARQPVPPPARPVSPPVSAPVPPPAAASPAAPAAPAVASVSGDTAAGLGSPPPRHGPVPPPAVGPAPPRSTPASAARSTSKTTALDSERWVGQRVFLGIGVVALLLAAGYLLKLSFDRNWISPTLRCFGGVVAGVLVGGLGWRLEPRYRTYGAALIGAGAGIIYLSIWAASRLYGVLPSAPGIVGLALVSVALAMIAYAIDVEALGVTAALGAFFAPVLLGQNRNNADLLLLYLASMAAGLGPGVGPPALAACRLGDRRQLFRGRHARRRGSGESVGRAAVRPDRRNGGPVRGPA